jgi:DNA gyrase inhibitor GyrI
MMAWGTLLVWAKETGLLYDQQPHRFFGFNNPDPSPASPNYGYEQWVTVGPEEQGSGDVKIKEFAGGLFGVTHCEGVQNIPATWQALFASCENGTHKWDSSRQYLEECLTPLATRPEDYVFDLFMPIVE